MWLRENDGVTIPSTWRGANDWNDHPLSLVLTISHVEKVEVIGCQTTSSSCTAVYNHLHLLDVGGGMCSSWRWWHTLDYKRVQLLQVTYH